ncbi:hypothetical protein DRN89_03620 [archaeon]|nr:MAG: hypothetical protein DRN89_03620 [archaeon]
MTEATSRALGILQVAMDKCTPMDIHMEYRDVYMGRMDRLVLAYRDTCTSKMDKLELACRDKCMYRMRFWV